MNLTTAQALLQQKSTPFYVFDMPELRRRIHDLRESLPGHVKLCYAVKANTFILEEAARWVDRLEICSPGELSICQKLQLPPEKFVVSGVYKEPGLMQRLIAEGTPIGVYTVESMAQFDTLYQAATANQRPISVLLRLTSGNQFGLDESEIEQIVRDFSDTPFLHIRGIQYFSGTQKTSLKRLKRELETLEQLIQSLDERFGYRAEELEFGPGFPVSYFQGDSFDEADFLRKFSDLLGKLKFEGTIALELGRSLAASCGSYFTRVVDSKHNQAGNYAIVDGGIHQLAYYGQFMAMKHPSIRVLHSDKNRDSAAPAAEEEWNICGSLCTVNDILVKKLPLRDLQIGDVLLFEKAGAYCATEGIALFLSRDLPEIILMQDDGKAVTVRPHIQTDHLNYPQK